MTDKRAKSSKQNSNTTGNNNSDSKNIGQFILGEKLGEGTFGKVRKATHILTGEKVAIKILEKCRILEKADKIRVEREIKILKMLKHKHIIELYSVIQNSTTIYLVMELSKGQELFEYIVKKKRLDELEASTFFSQIISSVNYLHSIDICHRDLKPENLLLNGNDGIKLVDFGLSNMMPHKQLLSTACGSPCYAAPEMLEGNKYEGNGVDIWSCGIILYAMVCGYLPFEDKNNDALYKKIKEGKFAIPSFVSEPCKDLIKRILITNPLKRIKISEILKHPWLNMSNPQFFDGLIISKYVIPIDEEIICKMEKYGFTKEEARANVLSNKHNQFTTTYYLLVKLKVKHGTPSISDLKSKLFTDYLKDNRNLIKNYKDDLAVVLKERNMSNPKLPELEEEKPKPKIETKISEDKLNIKSDKTEKNDKNDKSTVKPIKKESYKNKMKLFGNILKGAIASTIKSVSDEKVSETKEDENLKTSNRGEQLSNEDDGSHSFKQKAPKAKISSQGIKFINLESSNKSNEDNKPNFPKSTKVLFHVNDFKSNESKSNESKSNDLAPIKQFSSKNPNISDFERLETEDNEKNDKKSSRKNVTQQFTKKIDNSRKSAVNTINKFDQLESEALDNSDIEFSPEKKRSTSIQESRPKNNLVAINKNSIKESNEETDSSPAKHSDKVPLNKSKKEDKKLDLNLLNKKVEKIDNKKGSISEKKNDNIESINKIDDKFSKSDQKNKRLSNIKEVNNRKRPSSIISEKNYESDNNSVNLDKINLNTTTKNSQKSSFKNNKVAENKRFYSTTANTRVNSPRNNKFEKIAEKNFRTNRIIKEHNSEKKKKNINNYSYNYNTTVTEQSHNIKKPLNLCYFKPKNIRELTIEPPSKQYLKIINLTSKMQSGKLNDTKNHNNIKKFEKSEKFNTTFNSMKIANNIKLKQDFNFRPRDLSSLFMCNKDTLLSIINSTLTKYGISHVQRVSKFN